MLYAYLHQFDGVSASHTSATSMGTDWRDNDPQVEPVVEIYQGMRQNYEIPDGAAVEQREGFYRRMASEGIHQPGARQRLSPRL
jgi:hypothetical protein